MKKLLLLSAVLVLFFVNVYSQISPSKVLKGGEKLIIYEILPGDGIIAIPIHKLKDFRISNSGDDGITSTDNIAVGVYYQESIIGDTHRKFIPYKFSSDTLWIVLPSSLRNEMQIASNSFTGNIANPARIEIWNDAKIKGALNLKSPHTDQGWNYKAMINLSSIVTGQTEFPGNQAIENQKIAKQINEIFSKNYYISKIAI